MNAPASSSHLNLPQPSSDGFKPFPKKQSKGWKWTANISSMKNNPFPGVYLRHCLKLLSMYKTKAVSTRSTCPARAADLGGHKQVYPLRLEDIRQYLSFPSFQTSSPQQKELKTTIFTVLRQYLFTL